jgi:hypothetical protein
MVDENLRIFSWGEPLEAQQMFTPDFEIEAHGTRKK